MQTREAWSSERAWGLSPALLGYFIGPFENYDRAPGGVANAAESWRRVATFPEREIACIGLGRPPGTRDV